MVDISERNFEQVIEATLLAGGPDASSGGERVALEYLGGSDRKAGDFYVRTGPGTVKL
jgi:hypothetical protein